MGHYRSAVSDVLHQNWHSKSLAKGCRAYRFALHTTHALKVSFRYWNDNINLTSCTNQMHSLPQTSEKSVTMCTCPEKEKVCRYITITNEQIHSEMFMGRSGFEAWFFRKFTRIEVLMKLDMNSTSKSPFWCLRWMMHLNKETKLHRPWIDTLDNWSETQKSWIN